jgi:hypothetical protein
MSIESKNYTNLKDRIYETFLQGQKKEVISVNSHLTRMRQLYSFYQISAKPSHQLSCSHYVAQNNNLKMKQTKI